MREHTSLRIVEHTQPRKPITYSPEQFTREEKRRVFKGMVVGELEAGFLRYSRRKALMDYATRLGIPEFKATLLIAEAQYHSADIEPIRFGSDFEFESLNRPPAWPISLRLSFALMVAIFIDLGLIYWLFG